MTNMNEFFTLDEANSGKKLPLYTKTGEKTDEWLAVRGFDSDAFRLHQSVIRQELRDRLADDVELDAKERFTISSETERKTIAGLIIDWSFEMECNVENVCDFFTKAPQIMKRVEEFAGDRNAFFTQGLNYSTSGQEKDSA